MSRRIIWNTPWQIAFPVALGLGLIWLLVLRLAGTGFVVGSYLTSLSLGIVASTLVFLFLLRLPGGKWSERLLKELTVGGATFLLNMLLLASARLVTPAYVLAQTEGASASILVFVGDDLFTTGIFTLALSAFSFAAVRTFGHLYSYWLAARRKHLIWEITHAQLRLVLVIALLLMALMVLVLLSDIVRADSQGSNQVVRVLTNAIILLGILGIMTGVGLVVIMVPATAASYFTARRITRRLDELTKVTEAIREGAYDVRVIVEGEDEVAQLQEDFNSMAGTLAQTLQALQVERDSVAGLLQSRRELFAAVSHELRTPVATLRAYLDSLKRQGSEDPYLLSDLVIMERELLRLQRLIDDVFTLARAESGQLQLSIASVAPDQVVARCIKAARLQAWQVKKVDIILKSPEEVPLVLADEGRLEQVIHNLLRNAVRHTFPGGLVVVTIELEADMVRVDVCDTGEGIATEDLPHIWERFYRSAGTRAADRDGTGLGLTLVKEMTEAVNGSVAVESQAGEGSCFTIRLPRAKAN